MADLTVAAEACVALGATEHQFESFPGRDIALGALTVTRVLPVKGKRLVGPHQVCQSEPRQLSCGVAKSHSDNDRSFPFGRHDY